MNPFWSINEIRGLQQQFLDQIVRFGAKLSLEYDFSDRVVTVVTA